MPEMLIAYIERDGAGAFSWTREGNPGKAPPERKIATITGERREVERAIQGIVNLLNEKQLDPSALKTLTRRRRVIPVVELRRFLPDRSLRQERKTLPKRTALSG